MLPPLLNCFVSLRKRDFIGSGGTKTIKADVRLIVATNKDLEKAISAGAFPRRPLLSPQCVFTIFVPPLRERKSDMLLLADHFLEKYSNQHGKTSSEYPLPQLTC